MTVMMTIATIAATVMTMTVITAVIGMETKASALHINAAIVKASRPVEERHAAAIATETRIAIAVGEIRGSFDGHTKTATTAATARL